MVGIYKITSPINKVYVGQSTDIKKRWARHRDIKNSFKLKDLVQSFIEHGINNHTFEILYELPNDVSISVIDEYESFYINQFREGGFNLFNIKQGGSRGKHAASTLIKLSQAAIGREGFWKGKKRSIETLDKIIKTRKEKKYSAWNKGVAWSEATKDKIRVSHLGKSPSNKGVGKKITKEDVIEIKKLLGDNISQKKIALKFCISQSLVSDILHGKVWK